MTLSVIRHLFQTQGDHVVHSNWPFLICTTPNDSVKHSRVMTITMDPLFNFNFNLILQLISQYLSNPIQPPIQIHPTMPSLYQIKLNINNIPNTCTYTWKYKRPIRTQIKYNGWYCNPWNHGDLLSNDELSNHVQLNLNTSQVILSRNQVPIYEFEPPMKQNEIQETLEELVGHE
eukprot:NODE_131_length_16689_cov_0.437914.p11 type:complete len:175 gc:universal NODE_131_length_16689_cov_0.437914:5855-5331(-)